MKRTPSTLSIASTAAPTHLSTVSTAWIAAGITLSVVFKGEQSAVQFYVAGTTSIIFGLFSLTLPHTPPMKTGKDVSMSEILGLDALALLKKQNNSKASIFTDSKTALSWVKRKKANTKLEFVPANQPIKELLQRATLWLNQNTFLNPIVKWETERWGEIPADFGRK